MGSGPSQATKQQQQVDLQASKQELQFQTQLMSLFQKQYGDQKDKLDFLTSVLKPVISQAEAGNGFSTPELAAMRTSSTDAVSQQFQNAQAALNQELKTSGSANVPSGVTVGADAALLAEEARAQSGSQNQITLANAQQSRSNLFNAVNALNGVAAQTNPLGYGSEASGAGGTVAGLSGAQSSLQNSITNANSNSFFGELGGSFATALGGGLGAGVAGGFGTAVSQMGSGNYGW